MTANEALLRLCDAVLACDAVRGDLRSRWSALRSKASGQFSYDAFFADIFGGRNGR